MKNLYCWAIFEPNYIYTYCGVSQKSLHGPPKSIFVCSLGSRVVCGAEHGAGGVAMMSQKQGLNPAKGRTKICLDKFDDLVIKSYI